MPDHHTHILDEQGRRLVERLGGRWTAAGGGTCRCPAHEDRSPSLSVRVGQSRLLFRCFAGCDPADILRACIADRLLGPGRAQAFEDSAASARRDHGRESARRIWSTARPVAGTLAERYLERRGLRTGSPELRFHPRTPHGPKPFTQFRPALIAAVREGAEVVAVHRTFLESPGPRPARLPHPKCGLGRFASGAVRLGGEAAVLGLAEGIETALSATALFGLPCWATLGTERFGRIALPAQVTELHLFVDNDVGGRRAEALARAAFAALTIRVHRPRRPGDDWNDVLMRRLSPVRPAGGEGAGAG